MRGHGAVCWLWGVVAVSACAANWPGWRGPSGSGLSEERELPLRWSTNENVVWRVPLPDRGNSTPIVWGEKVFITQAVQPEHPDQAKGTRIARPSSESDSPGLKSKPPDAGGYRMVMCFDRRDGRKLWEFGIRWTEKEPTHDDNPPCTPSPVTDGERVIAWLGSAGVYCCDMDGRELWRRDLGRQAHQWGYASSPVLYRDLCFLNFGPGDRSFVIALDKKSGRTVWQYDVPVMGLSVNAQELGGPDTNVYKGATGKLSEIAGSWGTPLIVPAAGEDELVVALPLRLVAFAPRTGKQLWSCDGPNIGAYSAPFHGDGVVGYAGGGFRNNLMAVRPGGRGDVTKTKRLWNQTLGNSQAHLGAGVIFQGHIYLVNTAGIAECFELKSGKAIWNERLPGTGANGASWSSPVLAWDRLYVPNRNADVFVVKAAPKFELLAVNCIGGERMNASLAVSDGDIFIRTDRNLWCISSGVR